MFNVNVDININVKWMEPVCPRAFCFMKAWGGGSTHFPTRLSAIVNWFPIERLLAAVQTCSA